MFAIQCSGQVSALQAIDDLNGTPIRCISHQVKYAAFDDDILEIKLRQFGRAYLRDKPGVALLLGVGAVKTPFIFDKDHRFRAEDFADQVAAGVRSVWRDPSNRWICVPVNVRRHPEEDDGAALREVVRELREL